MQIVEFILGVDILSISVEILSIGALAGAWCFYWIGLLRQQINRLAYWFFVIANLLIGLNIIIELYSYGLYIGGRIVWLEIFSLVIGMYFIFRERALLPMFGLVLPVFLMLLQLLSRFIRIKITQADQAHLTEISGKIFAGHVLMISASYLLLSFSLISSLLFIHRDLKLKSYQLTKDSPGLVASVLPIELLLKLNYRFLLSSFAFLSLGILSGIYVAASAIGIEKDLLRLLIPLALWVLQATAVIYNHFTGIRGRVMAYWTIIIFCWGFFAAIYEFFQL